MSKKILFRSKKILFRTNLANVLLDACQNPVHPAKKSRNQRQKCYETNPVHPAGFSGLGTRLS